MGIAIDEVSEESAGDIVGCHKMFVFDIKAENEQSAVTGESYYTVATVHANEKLNYLQKEHYESVLISRAVSEGATTDNKISILKHESGTAD